MPHKFASLSNATTVFFGDNFAFIFDPWLTGTLYDESWSPSPKFCAREWISEINSKSNIYIYISHIHEDHWDLDTLNQLDQEKCHYFIPDFYPNKVIQIKLTSMFGNCKAINLIPPSFNEPGQYFLTLESETIILKAKVINPLNFNFDISTMPLSAEHTNLKCVQPDTSTYSDTGLLIHVEEISTKKHFYYAILGDNSPYSNTRIFPKSSYKEDSFRIIFHPFNSYADDYPICYENLDLKARRTIADSLNIKRMNLLIEFLKINEPHFCIPHSSDFILNSVDKNTQNKVYNNTFLKRSLFAEQLRERGFKTIVFDKDVICYPLEQFKLEAFYRKISVQDNSSQTKELSPVAKKNPDTEYSISRTADIINTAFSSCIERVSTQDFFKSIEEVDMYVFTGSSKSRGSWHINFKEQTLLHLANNISYDELKSLNTNKESIILGLKIDHSTFMRLLERKMHWDNMFISCKLRWKRFPAESYPPNFFKTLCRFHT